MMPKHIRPALLAVAALIVGPSLAAAEPLVGVNVVHAQKMPPAAQDDIVSQLTAAHVAAVRVGLGDVDNGSTLAFFERLKQHGIGIFLEISLTRPELYDPQTQRRPAVAAMPSVYSTFPLSKLNPEKYRAFLSQFFGELDRRQIKLDGIEIGNEINGAPYNGDFDVPGEGRVMGSSDLTGSPAGERIAQSLARYVEILRVTKDVRDKSSLNPRAPIVSAGLLDFTTEQGRTGSHVDVVSLDAVLDFLRRHGANDLVDGYGIHTYPTGNPALPVEQRMARTADYVARECGARAGGKPCYITEWGIKSAPPDCTADDSQRTAVVSQIRRFFEPLERNGAIGGLFYYQWSSPNDPLSIFRCGRLTQSGEIALRPFGGK